MNKVRTLIGMLLAFALAFAYSPPTSAAQCTLHVTDMSYYSPSHSTIFTLIEQGATACCDSFDVQVKPTGYFWEWHDQTVAHPVPDSGMVWIGLEKVTVHYNFTTSAFDTLATPQWEFRLRCHDTNNTTPWTHYVVNLDYLPEFNE